MALESSWEFAFDIMQSTHVAMTPGRDFGFADTANFVRFSTANSMDNLHLAIERLHKLHSKLWG